MKAKQLLTLFEQGYLHPEVNRCGSLFARCALPTCSGTCPIYRQCCSFSKPYATPISHTSIPVIQPYLDSHPEYLL